MGVDLYGNTGEEYRQSWWSWRPLWSYVSESCRDILDEKDIELGKSNDGHLITNDKSELMSKKLLELCDNGKAFAYRVEYDRLLDDLPVEECTICEGTGFRTLPPSSGKGDTNQLAVWLQDLTARDREGNDLPVDIKVLPPIISHHDAVLLMKTIPWEYYRKDIPESINCIPCNGCKMKGERDNIQKSYPFHEKTVKSFAEFCEGSGGFTIY